MLPIPGEVYPYIQRRLAVAGTEAEIFPKPVCTLIHGMRSAFHHRIRRDNRMTQLMERMVERSLHTNKIVVASANKAARIVWAVLAKNEPFQPAA